MFGAGQNYTVYAVKAVQPGGEGAEYWVPILYEEMKAGRARFGWGGTWEGLDPVKGADLRFLKEKLDSQGWEALSDEEKNVWSHASFLLGVQPGDYFVYINMPEWGECSIVKITGGYIFEEKPWDPEGRGDFRHRLPCEFVATFGRNANYVHPYLQRRLKLQGAWYRIYAQREFEELLEALETGAEGKTPEERLGEAVARSLQSIAYEAYRHFPEKGLEGLVRHLLSRHPYIRDVRKGPDTNGADLDVELEIPLGPGGLRFLCAVQVKSYEGTMGYQRAVEDIRRAFSSNPQYACGLIVSTALDYTKEFEEELEKVKAEFNRPVEVLLGKDIAYALVLDHMARQAEAR
jgi:hypothetical protein